MKQTVKILFTSLKMRKAKMDQGCSGDQFTEFLMNWILTLPSWFPAFFGGKVTPVSTEQNLNAHYHISQKAIPSTLFLVKLFI